MTSTGISITFFNGLTDPRGYGRKDSLSMDDLWDILSDLALFSSKNLAMKDGKYDKPASLSGFALIASKNDYRNTESLEYVYAVGLDFDGTCTLEYAEDVFNGWDYTGYTTFNHTEKSDRFRLFIGVSRPMSAVEYKTVWTYANKMVGGAADTAAADAARFWFMPGCPDEQAQHFSTLRYEGRALDVDAILSLVPEKVAPKTAKKPRTGKAISASTEAACAKSAALRRAAIKMLVPIWAPVGRRHAAKLALAGALSKAVSESLAHSLMDDLASQVGDDNSFARTAIVRDTYAKQALGGKIAGWPKLSSQLGHPQIVDKVHDMFVEANDIETEAGLPSFFAVKKLVPVVAEIDAPSADAYRIQISTDIARIVNDALNALRNDKSVYQRDGKLCEVYYTPDTAEESDNGDGAPRIEKLDPNTLCVHLTLPNVAEWYRCKPQKQGGFEEISAEPSERVLRGVLGAPCFPGIRRLVGLVETPLLRPDGTVLQKAGYDRDTGYLYTPTCVFPEVPDVPTQIDAAKALADLDEVFCDFPFVEGASKHVPVAALLTLLSRSAIGDGNVPAFVFEASMKRSGKSKQIDTIFQIATGRKAPKTTYPSKDEELSKVLDAHARSGAPGLCFDNVDCKIGGASLDKLLTCNGMVAYRILGKTEQQTTRCQTTVTISANNATYAGDISGRMIKARLEPQCENPETRTDWTHPDLSTWVLESRPRLVIAGLTLLRAYAVAGSPRQDIGSFGGFEEWSHRVAEALVWAGGENVLEARPAPDDEDVDPEKALQRRLFKAWPSGMPTTVRGLLDMSRATKDGGGGAFAGIGGGPPGNPLHEGLWEILQEIAPAEKGGDRSKVLSRRFRKWRGSIVNGEKVLPVGEDRHAVTIWGLQKIE